MGYTAAYWVDKLQLEAHPEGGFYRRTFQSSQEVKINAETTRVASTAIYYLLESGDFSTFHRLKHDEIWHHYDGCGVNIHVIHPNGRLEVLKLGKTEGFDPQVLAPKGTWFAVSPAEDNSFSLCGCTVAPGFEFEDFEMAKMNELLKAYPQHEALIRRFTREA